jgi:MSHA biogenesis protein MshQ
VTFDKSVTGVDAADFAVALTGATQTVPPVVVAGSGATYTVTINGISGAGTLGLNLVDNDSIVASGVALGGAGAANGTFTGQIYTIAPIVVAPNPPVE